MGEKERDPPAGEEASVFLSKDVCRDEVLTQGNLPVNANEFAIPLLLLVVRHKKAGLDRWPSGMLAPSRGKASCPAPPQWKLTKPARRSGAKLTADFMDTPFHYGPQITS